MTIDGYGPYQIANILKEEKILTPSAYPAQHGEGVNKNKTFKDVYGWGSSTICNILEKREYLGHTINFKTRKHFKDKKSHYVPQDEWTIFQNTHEPIIDQQTYDLVQKIRSKVRRYPDGWGETAPLTGLLYCADCGGKMYVHRTNNGKRISQYTCSQYTKVPCGTLCKTQHRINEDVVLSLVSEMLKAIAEYAKHDRAEFVRVVQEAQSSQQTAEVKKQRTRLATANFREAKNTGNGQEIMVSYIGDDDDIIATYQDLAKEYSISQPEFWQSTETDMMFIVWGLVAILMIVLNMIEVICRQKEVVVRASLGENAAVIALKAVVADMISYATLFVLAKLLVSQFISGAYEDHLILAVYYAGAVLSVIPYAAFVRFDVKKAFANASDKKGMFYLLNGLKVFATAMTIFTITTNLSSIQGNLLTNTTLLENHYNDYYFGVMQIEPPFEENEEESKESKFWNDLYENEYNTINPVVCIGSRIIIFL